MTLLAANGAVNLTVPLATNVANGQAGRRVLVGASDLSTSFGVTPDFSFASGDHLSRLGGAACFVSGVFGPVDCVSWGSFAGSPASPTGGNTAAMADTMAIARAGPTCGSGLTDTNSPTDWSQVMPDPSNNAAPVATGTACVNTTITKKPKARTQKRTARFEFSSTPASASFACKLDGGGFADCESPFSQRVGPGRHTFKVKAAGETSPATYRWKVVKK